MLCTDTAFVVTKYMSLRVTDGLAAGDVLFVKTRWRRENRRRRSRSEEP